MKLLFSLNLGPCEQPYASPACRYGGVLGLWQGRYVYARSTYDEEERRDVLILYTVEPDGTLVSEDRFPYSEETALPYLWRGYEFGGDLCIVMGEKLYFSLLQKDFLPISNTLSSQWLSDTHADDLRFYSEASFSMPPYELRHYGEQGYACFQNGRELWRRRMQGYLYTDMVRLDLGGEDAVIFGTDGAGGHFAALRLSGGEPIFDIHTGGTDRYLFDDDRFFVHQLGRGGGLLAVSPSGETELCPLTGVAATGLPLALCGKMVLALSFTRKGNRYVDVYLNAVCISSS